MIRIFPTKPECTGSHVPSSRTPVFRYRRLALHGAETKSTGKYLDPTGGFMEAMQPFWIKVSKAHYPLLRTRQFQNEEGRGSLPRLGTVWLWMDPFSSKWHCPQCIRNWDGEKMGEFLLHCLTAHVDENHAALISSCPGGTSCWGSGENSRRLAFGHGNFVYHDVVYPVMYHQWFIDKTFGWATGRSVLQWMVIIGLFEAGRRCMANVELCGWFDEHFINYIRRRMAILGRWPVERPELLFRGRPSDLDEYQRNIREQKWDWLPYKETFKTRVEGRDQLLPSTKERIYEDAEPDIETGSVVGFEEDIILEDGEGGREYDEDIRDGSVIGWDKDLILSDAVEDDVMQAGSDDEFTNSILASDEELYI